MEFKERVELLKSYIQRVTDGEEMESVQKDFKENFSHVPAKQIAQAEQEMMKDGMPFSQIQKLCDIHSVLFHDMTDEERMERLKEEMAAHQHVSYVEQPQKEEKIENVEDEVSNKTIEYKNTTGHPLNILTIENNAIKQLTTQIKEKIKEGGTSQELTDELNKLTSIATHYGKKDELLFPLLKDKYNYPGPSDVMWAVEDEIRAQLKQIIKHSSESEKLLKVIKRIEEMIYKEENILFPLCADNFTDDEWIQIAEDMKLYGPCLIDKLPQWDKKTDTACKTIVEDDVITLPGGSITLKQLRAMLNIIPMEITVVDEENINRFFDEDENKLFIRPKTALNRNMLSCHPPQVEKMVKKLISDFRSGKSDSMHVMTVKNGQKVLVNYYALRDENDEYLGTMEAVLHLNSIIKIIEEGKMGPIEL